MFWQCKGLASVAPFEAVYQVKVAYISAKGKNPVYTTTHQPFNPLAHQSVRP
jgi:hypothetical protein